MKGMFRTGLILLAAAAAACAPRERTLVLLSTNDMHAKIQNFPRLAAAVENCRDTAQLVVLVDAGDRWTGNAYVDMAATPGMPMIALMNRLGYDVATLGNHEFDHGQAFLRAQKMHAAAELLRSTDRTVLDIAGQFGYDNASKFARAFRSVIGVSPNAYRSGATADSCAPV